MSILSSTYSGANFIRYKELYAKKNKFILEYVKLGQNDLDYRSLKTYNEDDFLFLHRCIELFGCDDKVFHELMNFVYKSTQAVIGIEQACSCSFDKMKLAAGSPHY